MQADVCTGIRTGDIVHYEDTERGREALRKDAAFREGNDKLDEAAYALDTAYYTGTLAFVPRRHTPIHKPEANTIRSSTVSWQAYVCDATWTLSCMHALFDHQLGGILPMP